MTKLEQQSPLSNPDSTQKTSAPRYSVAQGWAFALQPVRNVRQYRANLGQGAASALAACLFSYAICKTLKDIYRLLASHCLHRLSHGYLTASNARHVLKMDGMPRSNVTIYLNRLVAAGLLAVVEEGLFKVKFYNEGTLAKQDHLVQILNSRVAKRAMKSSACERRNTYRGTPNGVTLCEEREGLRKQKKDAPKKQTAPNAVSHEGIGPVVLPAAKQGLAASPHKKPTVIVSKPLTAPPSPKIEKAPEGALEAAVCKLPSWCNKQALLKSIRAREREDVAFEVHKPARSEAETRGYTAAYHQEQAKAGRPKRIGQLLVPIRDTTASFIGNYPLSHLALTKMGRKSKVSGAPNSSPPSGTKRDRGPFSARAAPE